MSSEKSYKVIVVTGLVTLVVTVAGSVMTYVFNGRIEEKREMRKQQMGQLKTTDSEDYLFDAVINDPDGYTNVRDLPDKQSDIVDQIYENEEFQVLKIAGDWYKVKSPNGVIGFVFHNRVVRK